MGRGLAMMQISKFFNRNIFMGAMHSVYQTLVQLYFFNRESEVYSAALQQPKLF